VVNLDGVVSTATFAALKKQDLWGYMREQQIDCLLDWPITATFVRKNSHLNANIHFKLRQAIYPPGRVNHPWVLLKPIFN